MEEELDEVARGKREWVPLLRDFYGPFSELVDREAQGAASAATSRPRRPTRSARRATRWSSASAATAASWPARSIPSTRRRGRCPARRRRCRPSRASARSARSADRARWSPARTVRAIRRLLALSRLQVHPQDRPAAARAAAIRGHLPQVRRGPPRRAASAPDGQRLLGLLALSEVRLHLVARAARARCTTLTTARSRARARAAAICLKCGAPIELPEG